MLTDEKRKEFEKRDKKAIAKHWRKYRKAICKHCNEPCVKPECEQEMFTAFIQGFHAGAFEVLDRQVNSMKKRPV